MENKVKFCYIRIPKMEVVTEYLELSKQAQMSNFGPCCELLSERLHKYLNLDVTKEVVITSSAHTALMAAINVLDSIDTIYPEYTFKSTHLAITLQAGRKAKAIAVNQDGLLDINILENIAKLFDTLLLVCPLSNIPDLKAIENWCKEKDKKLIIDGASTFGTPDIYNYGDAFCLSFHATKSFPVGEGGALILDNQKKNYEGLTLADRAKRYINFGGTNTYHQGINGKVSEYTCAIALALLDEIEPDLKHRIMISSLYREELSPELYIETLFSKKTIYQTFPIYTNKAKFIIDKLLASGYDVRQYYQLPYEYPLTQKNICLPCHPDVKIEDAIDICKIIKENL